MIDVAVGGLWMRVGVDGPGAAALQAALAARWQGFAIEPRRGARPDVELTVTAGGGFSPDHHLEEPERGLAIAGATGGLVEFASVGGARGTFDARRGAGTLDGAGHLGEVDALLRLALSLALPARGGLLLHGTAVDADGGAGAGARSGDPGVGEVAVLVGASGAGKSTAAAALGGELGDELVVLHPDGEAVLASGTPYWRGRPARRRVRSLGVLLRGLPASRRALSGSEALRALAPHLVRYVAVAEVDRAALALLSRAVARLGVRRLECPEGAAFVPFLRAALDEARA